MPIESSAQKTRLAMMTIVAIIADCAVICGLIVWCCIPLVNKERQQVYVPDGDIPFPAERIQLEANFITEAKAHIQFFHQYLSDLLPDDDYIKWTFGKAMYMVDGMVFKQKQALDENGFYSDIVSSPAVYTITCDPILLDEHEWKFTYYGTQLIKRRTKDLKRSMVTAGYIENVPRIRNNLCGLIIMNWRTIENRDLDY